jgi:hypothetical protein
MTIHRTHPPTRAMRDNPDIDQLKRQARELLEAYRAQSPDTIIEVAAHHRTATPETFALHDAQFVLARSYGFERWPKLKAAVDGVTTTRLHEAVQRASRIAGESSSNRAPIANVAQEAIRGLASRQDERAIEAILRELERPDVMTLAIEAAEAMPRREFLHGLEKLQAEHLNDQDILRAVARCRAAP